MRKQKSLKNIIASVFLSIITTVLGFVTQRVFAHNLGVELLGLNSLFTSIISVLSVVELGIGPAMIFHLYKPLAEEKTNEVKSILKLYKKCYNWIAIIILLLGLIMIPFLPLLVKQALEVNIYIIFMMFVIDSSISYLITYKRSILLADQNSYIVSIIHLFYVIICNLLQILILIYLKNLYLYLLVKIVIRIIENVITTIIANKKYPYIKDKNVDDVEPKIKKDIFIKVKGLLFHKVGTAMVMGTDNIIISVSKGLGLTSTGLYNNYYLITYAVSNVLGEIFNAITSSVGNLLVKEDINYSYSIFKKLMFINFVLTSVCSIGILILAQPFITWCFGKEYLLPFSILGIIVIKFYMTCMRSSLGVFKDASGIFYEDRYIPVIESIVNLFASVILVNIFGLAGVFLGTIVSSCVVVFYSLPKYVYKGVFHKNVSQYILMYFKYFGLALVTACMCLYMTNFIVIENIFFSMIVKGIVTLVIIFIIYLIIFNKSEEYKYFLELIKRKK